MKINKILALLLISFGLSCSAQQSNKSKYFISNTNDFWNNYIEYKLEIRREDVWQTPEQSWDLKTGDCEDYAIIKYFDLIASGESKEKLSLAWVILKDDNILSKKYQAHVVILYDNNNEKWVLDNYSKEIIQLKERKDIIYIKAILNHNGTKIINGFGGEKIINKWAGIIKNYENHVLFMKTKQLEISKFGD